MASETSNTTTAVAEGSSAAISRVSEETVRQDPGPLPTKRGEIGYVESTERVVENTSSGSETSLPARHPADRDASPAQETPPPTTTAQPTTPSPSTPSSASPTSANPAKTKQSPLDQKIPGGFILSSVLAFIVQFIGFAGTITGWALIVHSLSKSTQPDPSDPNPDDSSSSNGGGFNSSTIFVHILFVLACLGQVFFLERRVWRLRAERYNHLHPGEILPTSTRRRWLADPRAIAYSPWNRPPLPTYAAALRESGGGTGDVEDHMIAVPPPPAYGNTRGSRLLLTGYLNESQRAQRPESVHSEVSEKTEEGNRSRPISYQSNDEEWEAIQDADRARRLEETLATLVRPTSRN